ncbi:MAG: transposase, partial [Thiotrichales bacterium]|nr:transposase [Thiotrichales bacterium]
MARLPRFNVIGQPQHIIVRGNNREPIFYDEADYLFYLDKLQQACQKHLCQLHAFVLMTNHVHLLITPNAENAISKAMQMIGRYYVQYFNQRYQRTGTLWEGRYKATLIDSESYALSCYRYIELNPVRAKMVEHAAQYPWSSYRCNAMGESCDLITPHPLYLSLAPSQAERTQAYRALFDFKMPNKTLDEIREATNKAWVLGSDYFKNKIQTQLDRPAMPKPRGGARKPNRLNAQNQSSL